ncbi:MAG: zinc ABC transporter substrate-binding protein [Marinibacterium sp.]
MRRKLIPSVLVALVLASMVRAESAPSVVADIAPVHSLVARVMEGVGVPELLVPASQSAHGVALRPSQMRALQSADLVVWVGPSLTPWLERALDNSGAAGRDLELLDVPNTVKLPFRDAVLFAHDHDGDAEGHDEHDEHDEHAGHDEHDDHGHGILDPHAWLDPENAIVWMAAIADRLAGVDPDHGDVYHANAETGAAEMRALIAEIDAQLAPARGRGMIAFHDAYHYFENRFDLTLTGSLRAGDAGGAGPARLAAVQAAIRDGAITCAFAEPQFNPRLLAAVTDGAGVSVSVLDPLGKDLTPGPDLYPQLLRAMTGTIVDCVAK